MSRERAVPAERSDARPDGWDVRVLPSGWVIEVGRGESLLAAAQRHSLRWPSACGGEAGCGTCFVRIERGLRSAACAAGPDERETLARVYTAFPDLDRDVIRLACQLRVDGPDMVVRRTGVRPAAAGSGAAAKSESEARGIHE